MPAGPLRLAAPPLAAQTGWLLPLALIGRLRRLAGLPRVGRARAPNADALGGLGAHLRHRVQRRCRPVSRLLPGGDGAGSLVWVLHRSGRASALWLPATILLTGFGQVHILVGMSCLLPLPRFWKSTLGPLRRGNPARPAHNPM